jgi:hypothetical protein
LTRKDMVTDSDSAMPPRLAINIQMAGCDIQVRCNETL